MLTASSSQVEDLNAHAGLIHGNNLGHEQYRHGCITTARERRWVRRSKFISPPWLRVRPNRSKSAACGRAYESVERSLDLWPPRAVLGPPAAACGTCAMILSAQLGQRTASRRCCVTIGAAAGSSIHSATPTMSAGSAAYRRPPQHARATERCLRSYRDRRLAPGCVSRDPAWSGHAVPRGPLRLGQVLLPPKDRTGSPGLIG